MTNNYQPTKIEENTQDENRFPDYGLKMGPSKCFADENNLPNDMVDLQSVMITASTGTNNIEIMHESPYFKNNEKTDGEGCNAKDSVKETEKYCDTESTKAFQEELISKYDPSMSKIFNNNYQQADVDTDDGIDLDPLASGSSANPSLLYNLRDSIQPLSPEVEKPYADTRKECSQNTINTIQCLVCGDQSSGVHYGVVSCEGCKGFFRRALSDHIKVRMKCIKGTQHCTILPGTRNRCPFCRLLKCLKVGMSRKSVKMGRRKSKGGLIEYEDEVLSTEFPNLDQRPVRKSVEGKSRYVQCVDNIQSSINTKGDKGLNVEKVQSELEKARARDLVLMNKKNGSSPFFLTSSKPIKNVEMSNGAYSDGDNEYIVLNTDGNLPNSSVGVQLQDDFPAALPGAKYVSEISTLPSDSANAENNSKNGQHSLILKDMQAIPHENKKNNFSNQQYTQDQLQNKSNDMFLLVDSKLISIQSDNISISNHIKPSIMKPKYISSELPQSNSSSNITNTKVGKPVSSTLYQTAYNPQHQSSSIPESLQNKRGFQSVQPIYVSPVKSKMPLIVPSSTPKYSSTQDQCQKYNTTNNRPHIINYDSKFNNNLTVIPIKTVKSVHDTSATAFNYKLNHIASCVLTTFKEIFEEDIEARNKFTKVQLSDLNEQTLNFLFGEQNWKENDTVNVDNKIQTIAWNAFHARFNDIIQNVVRFAKRIPGFSDLNTDDRVNLVRNGCFEAGCIIHSFYINSETDTWMGAPVFVLQRQQMKSIMPLQDHFLDQLFDLTTKLQKYHLTMIEIALFMTIILITPERSGLIQPDKVVKLQDDLIQAISSQLTARTSSVVSSSSSSQINHVATLASGPIILPRLLLSTSTLREINIEHRRQLTEFIKGRYSVPNDLYAETFELA